MKQMFTSNLKKLALHYALCDDASEPDLSASRLLSSVASSQASAGLSSVDIARAVFSFRSEVETIVPADRSSLLVRKRISRFADELLVAAMETYCHD